MRTLAPSWIDETFNSNMGFEPRRFFEPENKPVEPWKNIKEEIDFHPNNYIAPHPTFFQKNYE